MELIDDLNRNENVNGILVQLPVPDHIGLYFYADSVWKFYYELVIWLLVVMIKGLVWLLDQGCLILNDTFFCDYKK